MIHQFPFTGITGQEHAKKALLCALVCDDIRNILILGNPGTAKSTLVRSVESLTNEKKVITIPQNVTYDRLLGMIDLEKAITSGSIQVHHGILKEGNNQILYADDINLMDEGVIQCILSASETGQYLLEREGLSHIISTRFTFIASMDPSEGELSSGQLERFDLCIRTDLITDFEMRSEIVKKALYYEISPDTFIFECEKETETLKRSILKAKERFLYVSIPDGHADLISSLCIELAVQGYRGDIAVARTAKALAALDQRDEVMFDDIKLAALLALEHRRGECKERLPHPPKSGNEETPEQDFEKNSSKEQKNPDAIPEYQQGEKEQKNREQNHIPTPHQERYFDIGSPFEVIRYLDENTWQVTLKQKSGRRSRVISSDSSGHYRSFRFPGRCRNDIAIDATIRAAAPYQRIRSRNGLAISVKKSDIREKVREKKIGHTILFLVDASGSMGVQKRMIAVKGAILSLLKDAYQKRDRVGLMIFRGDSADLLLPPTQSPDIAAKLLKKIPTGGKTPLAKGITEGYLLLTRGKFAAPRENKSIVLLTDGRGNVPLTEKTTREELGDVARKIAGKGVRFIVVDTECGFPRLGRALVLARDLDGSYFRLEDLSIHGLAGCVNDVLYSDR